MITEEHQDDLATPVKETDSERTQLAKIIYQSQVNSAREHAAGIDLGLDRVKRTFDSLLDEGDRSAAIHIFALVEDLMADAFRRNLNGGLKGGWDEILSGNGLLATANDRITLLGLLYWIQESTFADLRLLKSIRNRFAHHADVVSFEDAKIASWVSALGNREAGIISKYEERGIGVPSFTARERYIVRACCIVSTLVADLAIGPAARLARVSPNDVAGRSHDERPENTKEAMRLAADVMLRVFPKTISTVLADPPAGEE